MNKKIIAGLSAALLVSAVVPIFLLPILLLAFQYYGIALLVLVVYYILNFMALGYSYTWERTDEQAKITWTFIQIFLPGAGAYIFFIFARVPRKQLKLLKESELLENEILKTDLTKSQVDLLENGVEAFPRLFEELEKAQHYINIQYFIMNEGIIHDKLFNILADKVKSGIKVRVLYDFLGNTRWTRKSIKKWEDAGIIMREFRPIKWLKANGGDNFRSHNKIVVVDGRVCLFGGLNIGDEYMSLEGKYGDWLDTHYVGTGEIVEQLDNIFAWQWHIETREDISKEWTDYQTVEGRYSKITLLNDSPERPVPITYNKILECISEAKDMIRIVTPYVAYPVTFKQAIREALERGVEVELITIGRADKVSSYYQSTFDTDTLTDLGAKIYRIPNTFIHTKMFIFDKNRVIIGTTNLDYRSLFHHFEFNLFMEDEPENTNIYNDYFERHKEMSELITSARMDWGLGRQLVYLLLRLFKGLF